jgi:hypothetical protein
MKFEAEDFVLRKGIWQPDPTHEFAWDEEEDCGGLPTLLELGPGAEVILRSNINVQDGLTNGERKALLSKFCVALKALKSLFGFTILP